MANIKLDIGVKKQGFSTNSGGIFYLDVTDTNVVTRFGEKYAEMQRIAAAYGDLDSAENSAESAENAESAEKLATLTEKMRTLDEQLKAAVDYVFDEGVSEAVWGRSAAAISLDNVLPVLLGLYEKGISAAAAAAKGRMDQALPAKYKKK